LEKLANFISLPTPTESVGVGRMFESVCLSVCFFCPEHNSTKRKIPKCSNLIKNGYPWNILEMTWFWGYKVKVWVKPKATAIRRGFELYMSVFQLTHRHDTAIYQDLIKEGHMTIDRYFCGAKCIIIIRQFRRIYIHV